MIPPSITKTLAFLQPYARLMRLDQPTGIWLLLWPCWWAVAMASPAPHDGLLLVLFGLGAVLLRGAGCIINDILDRKLDAQVERTKHRPLASGELSVNQAFILLGLVLLLGLAVLLQFNGLTILLGCIALLPVALYPLMKRITYWPQAFLGMTFNWGALMGWTAVTGHISLGTVFLYIAGIFWTLGYDTIYAHQDKRDDVAVGIKSTAIRLDTDTKLWVGMFYVLALIFLFMAGWMARLGFFFYPALIGAGYHLYWQLTRVDLHNPSSCMAIFRSNAYFGGIVFVAVVLGG